MTTPTDDLAQASGLLSDAVFLLKRRMPCECLGYGSIGQRADGTHYSTSGISHKCGRCLLLEKIDAFFANQVAHESRAQLACRTCGGVGLVGGHSGQTPDSYDEISVPCPDCADALPADFPSSEMLRLHLGELTINQARIARAAYRLALSQAQPAITVTDEMVQRFLGWRLPDTFAPDCYVSFDREGIKKMGNGSHWPSGTNLLNDPEARAMLEHVLAGTAQPASVADGWQRMTEMARRIQEQHAATHQGDVFTSMKFLCDECGYEAAPQPPENGEDHD